MSSKLHQQHLERVSRSFSFCIKKLDGQMRSWVGLTYLICRILDTVEDAPWGRWELQRKEFQRFDQVLLTQAEVASLRRWSAEFPEGIPDGEKLLLQDSQAIFFDFHKYPETIKKIIQNLVSSMSLGMQRFAQRRFSGEVKFHNIKEVNQYCFFVAGVIGEVLSNLLVYSDKEIELSEEMLVNSYHFGFFLQKVNLLKDQLKDEKEGRYFIPSRETVFKSLQANIEGAFSYIQSLPLSQRGYRLFCAWSFFLGLATLPVVQSSYLQGKIGKISRWRTKKLIKSVEKIIDQPKELERLYQQLFDVSGVDQYSSGLYQLRPCQTGSMEELESEDQWVVHLYKGLLNQGDLQNLGVFA